MILEKKAEVLIANVNQNNSKNMPELLPTIGRIVQFKKRTGEIFPAMITKVNPAITPADEITVALTIFEEFSTVTRSDVPRGDGFDHWDWLDYTKQQAK